MLITRTFALILSLDLFFALHILVAKLNDGLGSLFLFTITANFHVHTITVEDFLGFFPRAVNNRPNLIYGVLLTIVVSLSFGVSLISGLTLLAESLFHETTNNLGELHI